MSIIVDNSEAPKSLAVALSPLPPVAATGTRADSVFDLLRASIVQGELAPGSKINEPQLSKLYGISRGPLREAIRRLEGCKLVEIKANVGARVVELDIQKAIEIYEIREALEGLACGLAAERATASDCDQLRALLARHEAQIESETASATTKKKAISISLPHRLAQRQHPPLQPTLR
jgi:DNA-binding GntR family transcriptional regulator